MWVSLIRYPCPICSKPWENDPGNKNFREVFFFFFFFFLSLLSNVTSMQASSMSMMRPQPNVLWKTVSPGSSSSRRLGLRLLLVRVGSSQTVTSQGAGCSSR